VPNFKSSVQSCAKQIAAKNVKEERRSIFFMAFFYLPNVVHFPETKKALLFS